MRLVRILSGLGIRRRRHRFDTDSSTVTASHIFQYTVIVGSVLMQIFHGLGLMLALLLKELTLFLLKVDDELQG